MAASRTLLLLAAVALAGLGLTGLGLTGASAQTPNPLPPPAITVAPDDPFGEQVTMTEKTIVYLEGSGLWDSAFETIVGAFKSVYGAIDKLGAKPNGAPMTIYTATDDNGFQFQAAVPVAQAPASPPQGDIKIGKSPTGTALKFVHRGSYDEMDTTYEAIAHHLEEKNLEAKDLFVEQYIKDPVTTPEDDLVIEIYVPLK
ncbi:MAG TPA: GyrI-like domain-containing protein [Xanthobacteraceae bacterium]|jgi:effector-binding domain-containing protein|nr:GyrI-like domain-containing protein [Xanthobacteraceae bacterium]